MTFSVLMILILLKMLFFAFKRKKIHLSGLYKELVFIYLFCSILINGGYALKIGETSIANNTVLSIVILILSLFFLAKGVYNQKIMFCGLILWISIALGLLLCRITPYNGGVVSNLEDWDYIISGSRYISYDVSISNKIFNYIIGAMRFPIILAVLSKIISNEDIRSWINRLYKAIPYLLVFGYFEFIMKKILNINIYNGVSFFLGTIEQFPKLQGFSKEASQYAVTLFIMSLIIIVQSRFYSKNKKNILNSRKAFTCIIGVYLLMVLNTSLTSYCLLVLSILILLISVNANKKISIFVLSILGVFIIYMSGLSEYLLQRFSTIDSVIDTLIKGNEYHSYLTSEGARLSSMYYALKATLARPLTGIGLGGTDAHSTFFAILANFGFLGTYSYFSIWKVFSKVKGNDSIKVFYIIIFSTVISGGLGYFMDIYYPFICLAYYSSSIYREGKINSEQRS